MTATHERCDFHITTDELPDGLGGWSCWRAVWNGCNHCIWHADKEEKRENELKNHRGEGKERLDGAILRGTELSDSISFKKCTLVRSDFSGASLRGTSLEGAVMKFSDFSGCSLSNLSLIEAELEDSDISNHAHFFGCDLSNADLTDCDLTGANLSACDVSNCHLTHTILNQSTIVDCDFTGAWLSQSTVREVNIKGCDFSEMIAQGADFYRIRSLAGNVSVFDNANLTDADFEAADLGPVSFEGADIGGTNLRNGRFKKADFSRSSLVKADLSGSKLENASFVNAEMTEADLSGAALNDADMSGAILRKTDFSNANPNNTIFRNTEMQASDCTGADMLRADFSNSNLRQATLSNANLMETVFQDSNLHNADLSESFAERAVFTRANLFGVDFSGSQLYGAVFTDAQISERTRFEGHYSHDAPECATIDSEYRVDEDVRTRTAWVYQRLENLFRSNALPEQARDMYIRRKDLRRHGYREEGDWLRFGYATLSRWVSNYGDGPWHVIRFSVALIVVYAGIYPFIGGVESGDTQATAFAFFEPVVSVPDWIATILTSLYFSTVTFTTLGYGDLHPANGIVQALAAIESFLGAVLMALLVFVLGRRATW